MTRISRVLIVAADFAPSATVGAKRPTGVAIELARQGVAPVVATLHRRCIISYDDSRELGNDQKITVLPLRCNSIWHHSQAWRSAPPGWRRLFAVISRTVARATYPAIPIDPMYPWATFGVRQVVRHLSSNPVDIIWATMPTFSSMVLARRVSKQTGIPFVLDYRDIPDEDDNSPRSKQLRRIQSQALQECAGLTYVAPDQMDDLVHRYPFLQTKPNRLVYNFFGDPFVSACGTATSLPCRTIVYGGSLYGGERKADVFVRALARVQSDRRPVFFFWGSRPEQTAIRDLFCSAQIESSLSTADTLPHAEFIQNCHAAAIQLMLVGRGRRHTGTIPGKLYDYLATNKPILVVGPENCRAGQLVESLNRGIAAADDCPEHVKESIEMLLEGRNKRGKPLDLRPEVIQDFSQSSTVSRLLEFLQVVVNQNK